MAFVIRIIAAISFVVAYLFLMSFVTLPPGVMWDVASLCVTGCAILLAIWMAFNNFSAVLAVLALFIGLTSGFLLMAIPQWAGLFERNPETSTLWTFVSMLTGVLCAVYTPLILHASAWLGGRIYESGRHLFR